MAKVIQVRNVPDHVHAALVRQAAAAGLSLSDAVLRELEVVALRNANEELLGRLALLPPSGVDGAALVRAERDAGEERPARGARP
ncbi:MAG: FitA-like ribbon-helix-helix domain-containing protein [Microthrixaceae bacterium]